MEEKLLAELLAGHPVTGEYSSDPSVAESEINDENIEMFHPISSASLIAWGGAGPRIAIKDASEDVDHPARAIAMAALDLIAHPSAYLDLNDPAHSLLLGTLEATGVISGDESSLLWDSARYWISRAKQLGMNRVRVGTIERVMA